MTSSFRDPTRLGATNYLSTEADLSKAVNAELDNTIRDTQEFYQRMAELEKARYDQRFENIKGLLGLVEKAAPIVQDIQEANENRIKYKNFDDDLLFARNIVDEEFAAEELEAKRINNEEKQFAANAAVDANNPNLSDEQRRNAKEAEYNLKTGSFQYAENTNSKTNIKEMGAMYPSILNAAIVDNSYASLDNKILSDIQDVESAKDHVRNIRVMALVQFVRARRLAGHRELRVGEIRKYLAPSIKAAEDAVMLKWSTARDERVKEVSAKRDRDELSSMFQNMETLTEDLVGKDGWITNKKLEYEAGGYEPRFASEFAFKDAAAIITPMINDPESKVTISELRALRDLEFNFPGGKMLLSDDRAPRGAKTFFEELNNAILNYDTEQQQQKKDKEESEYLVWKDTNYKEFMEANNQKPSITALREHTLEFMLRFNITEQEKVPEWLKGTMTDNFESDERQIIEIERRLIKNLPITQSMVDKIVDPEKRAAQSQNVNTPELGAFTKEEAESMEEIAIAIVKQGKNLRDLNQAKTPKYIFARDAAIKYVTQRFKQLVVGGTPRGIAMDNAIDEAIVKMGKGVFDNRKVEPINAQNVLDLQATVNALQKDTSLVYSTEEWAGEEPHLDLAAEYVRTKGQSRYPSYYLRFIDLKKADGTYLTPEELFETRLRKTGRMKDGKIIELPEVKELKNDDGTPNVDDQNKLLNKNNATKTLEVASKGENITWMTSQPSLSGINAEAFVRRLEENIQRQQTITGLGQTHRQKTTLSKEDNDKLLEAVPELKEAPFLNPNTLSTAAINAMLKLNI